MKNPHETLSQELQNILDAQIDYHRAKLHQFQTRQEKLFHERHGPKNFSLARAILDMSVGSLTGGDREFLERCAIFGGVFGGLDPQRVFIPWTLLQDAQRDLTVANAASAGFLVAASVGAVRDVLRGWSVALSAGITVIDGLEGALVIPRVTTSPTGYAIPTEATAITESQPVLGQVALNVKNLACFCEFSRLLAQQANAEELVRMVMVSTLGKFLDAQILSGSGAAGELHGIFNIAGTQTQSGTSLAHAATTTMKKLTAEAGAVDREIAFVSTPAVRQLLENREKATGNGGFVWENGLVAEVPAFASNECPTASMLCGPWAQVILGQWGPPGLTLEINPYDPAGFKAGIVQARMILSVDVGVIRPSAFIKSTSIT